MGGTECGTPAGIRPPNTDESDVVLPSADLGTLIGRVGSGPWFRVGTSANFTSPATGRLILMFNDRACCYGDNSGSIEVLIGEILP
jgi:hypothetical protein